VSSGPTIPHREQTADLVVRPDQICVPFALRLRDADPAAAVGELEGAVGALEKRFGAVTSGTAKVRMLGTSVVPAGTSKLADDHAAPPRWVSVDGTVEIPLAAEAGFWERAKLLAALTALTQSLHEQEAKASPDKPIVEEAFSSPELKVREPEAFRAELTKRWVERARAFARAAESNGAPLDLVDCAPPAAIQQTPLSVEQVGLSLVASCHLDAVRRAP
jgi:hypothetical protein